VSARGIPETTPKAQRTCPWAFGFTAPDHLQSRYGWCAQSRDREPGAQRNFPELKVIIEIDELPRALCRAVSPVRPRSSLPWTGGVLFSYASPCEGTSPARNGGKKPASPREFPAAHPLTRPVRSRPGTAASLLFGPCASPRPKAAIAGSPAPAGNQKKQARKELAISGPGASGVNPREVG
jgi:hypothetical protein